MHPRSREDRSGLVLWVLCAGALGISLIVSPSWTPSLDLCWSRSLTQHPCPGCGLTRSFLAIGHGQWGEAWVHNPFGFFWYALAFYGFFRPFLRKFKKRPVEGIDVFLTSGYFWIGIGASMILVWGLRSFV